MRLFRIIACVVGMLFLLSAAYIEAAEEESVSLTVYNQNFALVKDRRFIDVDKKTNQISFTEVAALIEPASVHFKSLTAPDSCVIKEQNYEYDLVSATKLLSKYIDRDIKIVTQDGSVYEGRLLSFDNKNIVISNLQDDSLRMITFDENIRNIDFPKLPEGLITKPTLMWQIQSEKKGRHLTELSYLTRGINWLCDYVAIASQDDSRIDLSGWVTIDNKSGAAYKDAGLKLIAGEVHKAEEKMPRVKFKMYQDVAERPSFEEKPFFEYHMYTLQRKTTLKENQTKQVSLLEAVGVPVKKLFIYDPVETYGWYYYTEAQQTKEQKVKVKLELVNSKDNNLGMPLPKGKVRVYKCDEDGSLEFIGEDLIDHTPKDEKIRLYLGDAFDVVGERKRTDYKEGGTLGHWVQETYEISLRNHKEEDIEVTIVEHLWRYSNWKISNNSHEFTKKDAQTIEFKVAVPKKGEGKVTYTVKYWW